MLSNKNNKLNYLWSPFNLSCYALILALCASLTFQLKLISEKNLRIVELRKKLSEVSFQYNYLNNKLSAVKGSLSDIRIFQKELVSIFRKIDQNILFDFESIEPKDDFKTTLLANSIASKNLEQELFSLSSSCSQTTFSATTMLFNALKIQSALDEIPSLIPSNGYISSTYGVRLDPTKGRNKRHNGIDIAAAIGTPVYAPADAVVKTARNNFGFGKMIELVHPSGYITRFGHMSELLVKRGEKVLRGQRIGSVGDTGEQCRGAHLHYEVRDTDERIYDPATFFVTPAPSFEDQV